MLIYVCKSWEDRETLQICDLCHTEFALALREHFSLVEISHSHFLYIVC